MTNHPNRSKTRPTSADVRKHYEDQGSDVRIDDDGRVEYRPEGETEWLEGRYVSEYRFVNGQVVLV